MVTINAAKNYNLQDEFGSISKGKFADLFLIDLGAPNLFSSKLDQSNIYNLITQRSKSENIYYGDTGPCHLFNKYKKKDKRHQAY